METPPEWGTLWSISKWVTWRGKQAQPHTRTHRDSPFTSSVVLQSKETPDLFRHNAPLSFAQHAYVATCNTVKV